MLLMARKNAQKEYVTWLVMRRRCNNPNHDTYKMKALKDDRVLIGIGVLFFGIAFIDQVMTKADNLNELSIVGKTSCAIMGAVLAWFVIKYMIIGLIFKRK